MADPFVHLHVASGYSLQYGASHPHVLVERAAEQEMDTLALTDRDGTYGAVRFVKAAMAHGIRPVLGVDLAFSGSPVEERATRSATPPSAPRTPTRGGASRDARLPRVTFLASGKAGWAAVCRLVSATHAAGERGTPVCTPALVAEHVSGREVRVLLGPTSELGRVATLRRDDLGDALLRRWLDLVDPGQLVVEVVSHRLAGSGPGSSPHAARMAGVARTARVTTVLSNAVRYADRLDAPTIDVLDAARRLVPMDLRHLDRRNAEGFLKSGKQMHEVAEEICRYAGLGEHGSRGATELLAQTRRVADQCVLDPREDLGIGEVHFPEFEVSSAGAPAGDSGASGRPGASRNPVTTSGLAITPADAELRARCEGAIGWRFGDRPRQRIWKRLDDELQTIGQLGFASYFLTVGDVTTMVRELGIRSAARGSGAGSLVNYLLGISGVDPIRHGLLMERFLSPLRRSLPDIDIDVESARRLEVYDAILDRFGTDRCATVSMMDTYKVRHAIRDVGAALGMPVGEIDAIAKAFPHIRARDARMALRDLPELRSTGMAREAAAGEWGSFDLFFRLVESLDGLPRHIAMHPCGVLLSDRTLLDRTPVEQSFLGYPMSQFDKEDVEDLGLLKLDVLGIRMQSAMAHAVGEVERLSGHVIDLDDEVQVPFDDPTTYSLISSAKTLGVFQIESPGQRELVGKSGIEDFADIIADISLFRPGQERHDHALPRGQERLEGRDLPARGPATDPRRHPRRGGLPRAGDRDHRPVRGLHLRGGRRVAPGARRPGRHGPDEDLVLPACARPGLLAGGGGADLEGDRGLRLVRLLQGPRGRVRAADLPVGLAQGALPGPFPLRCPHPRPGHVSQATDPRRRPPARHRRSRSRRQRQPGGLRRGGAGRHDTRPRPRRGHGQDQQVPAAGWDLHQAARVGGERPHRPDGPRLGHPDRAGGGARHQRRRGQPDRGGPRGGAVRLADRLLPAHPGLPPGGRTTGAGRGLRHRLRHRDEWCRPSQPADAPRPAPRGR